MPLTVTLTPDVTATQSSWLDTQLSFRMILLLDEKSKPSLLWAAGSPSEREFAAFHFVSHSYHLNMYFVDNSSKEEKPTFPAELSRVRPDIVSPTQPVTVKRWTLEKS